MIQDMVNIFYVAKADIIYVKKKNEIGFINEKVFLILVENKEKIFKIFSFKS